MKHRNAEVIKAFADGIECEYWCNYDKVWRTFFSLTIFEMDIKVRIKPELPKEKEQEQEPQYLYVYNHMDEAKTCMSPSLIHVTSEWEYMGKVKVEK